MRQGLEIMAMQRVLRSSAVHNQDVFQTPCRVAFTSVQVWHHESKGPLLLHPCSQYDAIIVLGFKLLCLLWSR